MSVGEDVHCEFVKQEVHLGVRQEAVRLVREAGLPIAYLANDIGVVEGPLGKWVELERQGSDDGRNDAYARAENARLRRELAEVKMIMHPCQRSPPSSLRSSAVRKILS